jgi:hypothetical protein
MLKKTPYELWKSYKSNISYFRVFGSKYFVLNKIPRNIKFDPKSTEGIFVGYSITSKAYRVDIPSSRIVVESVYVKFDECTNKEAEKDIKIIGVEVPHVKDDRTDQRLIEIDGPLEQSTPVIQEAQMQGNALNEEQIPTEEPIPAQTEYHIPESLREVSSHPLSNVIGNLREGVRTRSGLIQMIVHCAFISQVKPKNFKDANVNPNWICAM